MANKIKRQKPKVGELFWRIRLDGYVNDLYVDLDRWTGCARDEAAYRNRLICETREQGVVKVEEIKKILRK